MFIGLLGLASMSLVAEGIWTKKADMPTARAWMASAVVDGKIYAIGGTMNPFSFKEVSTVEVFDPGNLTAVSPQGKLSTTWGEVKRSK